MTKYKKSVLVMAALMFAALGGAKENVKKMVPIDSSPVDRNINSGVVSYAESLNKIRPAVVTVTSKITTNGVDNPFLRELFGDRMPRQPREQQGLGSGVIVSDSGYILTNNHVVEGADEVVVMLTDDREFEAEIVGTDPQTDIAVLKIEGDDLPVARVADSENLEVGDVVFAIGNPMGVGQTATMGIVSATGRSDLRLLAGGFENFIQTDASINRGNSGGALSDAHGRLIGINTMILTDGRSMGNIGIGFAVPANMAHSVMTALVETGTVDRGFLGVGIQDLTSDIAEGFGLENTNGALVTEVNDGTPAEKAGLQSGDIIVEVDGKEVDSTGELRLNIGGKLPGTEIDFVIIRDGERMTKTAVLASLNDAGLGAASSPSRSRGFLEGITIETVNDELREQYEIKEGVEGVVVTEVSPDSPYANSLPEGMVILKINGRQVDSVSDANSSINEGDKNMLLIVFGGVYRWVSVDVE
ncbi:MAG: Do family serine endopeptidase [Verrucomicrobiota bacterium]